MVSDKEIKTQVSPFAVRENEVKVFDGKEGFASINQVVFKIDMGYINDLHFKVLEVINEFGFITSRQIAIVMLERGLFEEVEISKVQDKVTKKLEDLIKSKIVNRYYFESSEGKSSYRAYCLDKIASYLLKSRNIPCTWQPTDNTKPSYAIKRKLSGNQVLIAYMQKVKAFKMANPSVVLFSKKYNVKFKPTGGQAILDLGDKREAKWIFEVVRRNEDWQGMLIEKLQLMSDFYENFKTGDSGYSELPQLVFVGEDTEHCAEIFRIAKKMNFAIPDSQIYFTTDLKQLEDELNKTISVFEFDEANNKYKLRILDLEILKPGENANKGNIKREKKYTANTIIE